jgi:hypothetical protein
MFGLPSNVQFGLSKLVACVAVLSILGAPVRDAARAADEPFSPIAGDWSRHGLGLSVSEDGSVEAIWRVYRWCGPGVQLPCDELTGNLIISGGRADITLNSADDSGTFQGEVNATSDPELLDVGPVSLVPQPFGMLLLEQGDMQLTLCGPHFIDLAPPEVRDEFPCGA